MEQKGLLNIEYTELLDTLKDSFTHKSDKEIMWYHAKCNCGFETSTKGSHWKKYCPACNKKLEWEVENK